MTRHEEALARAARLSLLPGMSMARAARAAGVPLAALRRARKEGKARLSRDDLLLGALTGNAERAEGEAGDTASLAAWLDHVNHDGTTAAEVSRDLARLAAAGWIRLEGEGAAARFRMLRPWP